MKFVPRALFGALLLATGASSFATTLKPVTEEALTQDAEAIVVGTVASSRTEWIGRTLVTSVTVDVDETLKGEGAPRIEVLLPGGIDTKRAVPVAVRYPGAPTLVQGEGVVLFLNSTALKPEAHVITGFSQGKYTLSGEGDGAKSVQRAATGDRSDGVSDRRTLEEFRLQLQDHLAKPTR
jgi:hypothetical protein